jgi:hypothetical protein
LSNSSYVQYRIKEFVAKRFGNSVTVIIPESPTSAICRGAAIHARERNLVLYRKSRDSLGIMGHVTFAPEKHEERDRIVVPGVGDRADNQMKWSITKVCGPK